VGFEWVTNEMFDEKLQEICDEEGAPNLLTIPGVYEVLSEHFNNEVLDCLQAEKEEE